MRYTVTYTIQYDIVVENYNEAREHVECMANRHLVNFSFADVIKAEIKEKEDDKYER